MNKITIRNIVRSIAIILLIIQTIILSLVALKNPVKHEYELIWIMEKLVPIVIVLILLAIIIYIIEHKKYNKNEEVIDEYDIPTKFDIDNIKDKDILYLSAVLNQKLPDKKDIVLLIMQLINNKSIDLSIAFDGEKYRYFIEKRQDIIYKNNIEYELINYIFRKSDKVDLIKTIKKIYNHNEVQRILNKCSKYIENEINIRQSNISIIYKILTVIISLILGFLVIFVGIEFILVDLVKSATSVNSNYVIINGMLIGGGCILLNFITLIILKKVNLQYQYDNDWCLWVIKVLSIFEILMLISYAFSTFEVIQFIFFVTYTLALLTIMIKYNKHICLSKEDLMIKAELISVKKYLKSMNYLKDKEFGNIITYEQYIMYGFLFNITIKINNEFDILQKELKNAMKKEGILYWRLLNERIESII